MHHRLFTGLILAALGGFALAPAARGAAAYKEDLRDCKLPHGELLLPVAGTADAAKRNLLNIKDGALVAAPAPEAGKTLNRTAIAEQLRVKNIADLEFLPGDKDGGKALWAVSGRIVDIGAKYLAQAAEMTLDRPAPILGDTKRPEGYLPGIQEGRTFLLETTDGHFALVRVLEITQAGALVQFVYQPTGTIHFELPPAALIDMTPEPGQSAGANVASGANPASTQNSGDDRIIGATGTPGTISIHVGDSMPGRIEPTIPTYLAERQQLISARLKTLRAPATTASETLKKVAAINDLATLNAGEAVDSLISQISFAPTDAGKEPFDDSVHPCFAALKKLGKPASDAAIKTLRQLDLAAAPGTDILQMPAYRARLLGLVIRGVEGDIVGEFILRQERDAAHDDARRAMYDQLISPRPQ